MVSPGKTNLTSYLRLSMGMLWTQRFINFSEFFHFIFRFFRKFTQDMRTGTGKGFKAGKNF
ncbi:hypothetical protein COT07_03250 [Candidatus Woesearchaeota archaeon CG07_land_8_20_14_0_80_44_23]|nr:MAG: hypothetical protein COT07_03250 [Candidatus Woesearchaeota archaeon CG07_land_8_20_14_0_80_44_23]